ncbi:phytanoyl-CoA dioxygenase family protein [Caballeronia sp. AZ1_KS37]|uniref:phytanoyl-CoA dioxygenase family protein n=1 Tax=Caballeronia sp. AZ1_KS37 TaxID=2921756 RepID=UPI0032ED00C0
MALSTGQLDQFRKLGYVGPVEIVSAAEMSKNADSISHALLTESEQSRSVYGIHCNRDVHLYSRAVLELCLNANLISCLTQILGDNILLWRSTVFHKPPADTAEAGFTEIDWHQGMDFIRPAVDLKGLYPSIGLSREDNLKKFPLNVTAWIAVDDATEESGTLVFAPGSNALGPLNYVEAPRGEGFHNLGLRAAYDGRLDPSSAVTVPVPPGSCMLFDNLVFHKSLPNRSRRRRLGFACRFVSSDVPVYRNGDPAGFDITNWGCIQVAGTSEAGHNKILSVSNISLI